MAVTYVGSIAMKIMSVEDGLVVVVVGAAALFSWAETCYIRVIFLKEQ